MPDESIEDFREVIVKLEIDNLSKETPTTFVPLSPERIEFKQGTADILFGVFHIKWADMPKPATYALKLCDLVVGDGTYLGSQLECRHPTHSIVPLLERDFLFFKPANSKTINTQKVNT